nr:ribonuclease H-like domain-containing protein [Tanacetum cinerariifolium]
MLRDNALVDLRKKFEKAEQERDKLKLKLEIFQTSLKNLSQLLASQITDKTGLGYDNHMFHSTVFDSDELISSESDVRTFIPPKSDLVFHDAPTVNETVPTVEPKDESEGVHMPTQKAPSFVPTPEHVKTPRPSVKLVEHPILAENHRKYIPKSRGHKHSWNIKACFVCKSLNHLIKDCDYYEKKMVQKHVRNHAIKGNHQHYARITNPQPHRHVVPTAVLTRSRLVSITAARPDTTVVPRTKVQHQRPTKHGVTKEHSPKRRPINLRPSPSHNNFYQKVTTVQATQVNVVQGVKGNWGNPQHALKDKGVIDSGMKREFSVARTPQQNRIAERKNRTLIEAARTMLAYSLLLIPFWAEAVNTACYVQSRVLVTKPHNKTPYELLLGRTSSIGFMRPFGCLVSILNTLDPLGRRPTWLFDIDTLTQSMNYQPIVAENQPNSSAGIQEYFDADKAWKGNVQQYVLFPLWSTCSKDPHNTDVDTIFEVKEPESAVHVSPSSCDKTKKHDDKTKREAKGKSHVELSTGVRNLSKEFEDFSSDTTNGVNAASTPVPFVQLHSTNSTNTFSAAGPSNNAVSLNFKLGGRSSYVDPSQYLDDPNMPALEDITYSDDEEDVGAEADFSNLEINITVSYIPTTRVHKDHPVT